MTLQLNPVARGDLRSRLASPKILWILRLYVAVLSLLAVFSLPPEGGRLPGMPETELVQLFLLFQLGWMAYLTSALAVGEIGVEGEKGILDLAVTSFAPRTIAAGKLATAVLFALALVAAAVPLLALITPLDVAVISGVARALAAMVLLAVPLAIVGTWLTVAISSDLLRTLVHWSLFLAVFAATRWLADPLARVNPLRVVVAAYRGGPVDWPVALLPYLLLAAAGTALTARAVSQLRRAEGS